MLQTGPASREIHTRNGQRALHLPDLTLPRGVALRCFPSGQANIPSPDIRSICRLAAH